MIDTLAVEVVKLLGEALKENGAREAKLNSLEPAHYAALKEHDELKRALNLMQSQRDRAQKELRDKDAQMPKLRAMFTAASAFHKEVLSTNRHRVPILTRGEILGHALDQAKSFFDDEIPF